MEQVPRPGVVVGAGPILRAVADRIGLVSVIDQAVAWDAERCLLSPGERILALILNLLTDRQPLYPVTDAFRLTDVPLLLGPGVTAADLTDDALGRALDKLAAAGAAAVFSAVAARAYAVEAIDRGGMHFDTTSRSLYGDYPTADGAHGVTPRHGHSKDHRDDLKQILFTCFVNREGVPLRGTVEDGNRSDKRLNRHQIARIVQAFSPEALRDLVYIADSALVTGPHLDALAAAAITWLSRLPDTFGVAATRKPPPGRRTRGSPWAGWRSRRTPPPMPPPSRRGPWGTSRTASWSTGRPVWTGGRRRRWSANWPRRGPPRSGRWTRSPPKTLRVRRMPRRRSRRSAPRPRAGGPAARR